MLEKSSLASSRMNKDPRIEPGTHVLKRFLQACLAFSSDFEGPVFCTAVPEKWESAEAISWRDGRRPFWWLVQQAPSDG
jgi:hypothetical protein